MNTRFNRTFILIILVFIFLPGCIYGTYPCNRVVYHSIQPPPDAGYVILVRNIAPRKTICIDPINNQDIGLSARNGFCFISIPKGYKPPTHIAFRNIYTGEIYWKASIKGNLPRDRIFISVAYNEQVVSARVPGY